jgi:hypothetical protein
VRDVSAAWREQCQREVLNISPFNVIGVGGPENEIALQSTICCCSTAAANASNRSVADVNMNERRGAGVARIAPQRLENPRGAAATVQPA